MSKAKEYVLSGESKTHKDGTPYFEPSNKDFGEIHYGSSNKDSSNYLLFDDDSVVYMVGECVLSVFNNKTKSFE